MNSLVEISHCQPFSLESKEKIITGGLCFIHCSLGALKENNSEFLHPEEIAYFKTLQFERRQLSYLLGRFAAKKAVVQCKNIPLNEILIEYGVFQQPIVSQPPNLKIQVSYSHCNEHSIAVAFPEGFPMGIDIEEVNIEKQSVIATQLLEAEKNFINDFPQENPTNLFTLFWTIKEALSKALRTGMMTPFELYAIQKLKKINSHTWSNEFKNFGQYQAISFFLGKVACSIVYPKNSKIIIDTEKLRAFENR